MLRRHFHFVSFHTKHGGKVCGRNAPGLSRIGSEIAEPVSFEDDSEHFVSDWI